MKFNRLTLLTAAFIIGFPVAALARGGDHFKDADSNGDGIVDLAEFLAGHDKRFADLDGNGDAMITEGEAKAAFAKFHERMGGKHGNRFFEQADTDKDGKIAAAESAAAEAKRFRQMDADADGFVTVEEAKVAFDKLRAEHGMSDGKGNRFFDRADADKDGKISKAEWEQGGQTMFAKLDKNADGKITPDEMKRPRHGDESGDMPG